MKKLIAIVTLLGLLSFSPSQSHAGDDWGWFAAGAAAGIITGAVMSDSAYHHSHYSGCGHYGYSHHVHYEGCGHHGYSSHVHYSGCGHYGHSYHTHYPGCGHYSRRHC